MWIGSTLGRHSVIEKWGVIMIEFLELTLIPFQSRGCGETRVWEKTTKFGVWVPLTLSYAFRVSARMYWNISSLLF